MMREFAVWAPDAARVDLVVDDERVALTPTAEGWWHDARRRPRPGERYGYAIDGGPVRPDPRSASQPEGVDGLSEVIDHDSFAWRDRRMARRVAARRGALRAARGHVHARRHLRRRRSIISTTSSRSASTRSS